MKQWDVNKPVENKELVELLDKRDGDIQNESEWNQLMNEICKYVALEGIFLAVVQFSEDGVKDNGDGTATFTENTEIAFEHLSTQDGQSFLPVYTDWENLRKNENHKEDNVQTILLRFEELVEISKNGAGVVINPFSHNVAFSKEHLEYMLRETKVENVQQQRVEKDTQVLLGEPKEYPHQMVEAIKTYAKDNKSINAIYLKLMIKDDEKSFLLVVDSVGDQRSTFDGIAGAGKPFLPKGMFIDMVPYADSFGKRAADNQPFYQKKKSWLKGLFGR